MHNRREQTVRFLDCLLAQTYGNYRLVLVDDGSTDASAACVKEKIRDVVVITGKGDWWWAGGLHQGYLWLKQQHVPADDLVLMINNDTEFGPEFLQTAVDFLEDHPRTLAISTVKGKRSGRFVEAGVHVDWRALTFEHTDVPDEVNCASTRGLFLRAGDLFDIGSFYPAWLPHYLSDYEFTIRAYRKGYRLATPQALMLTVDETSTGYHELDAEAGWQEFWKKYFSRRSSRDPRAWMVFIILVCPWPWKAFNMVRVIYGVLSTVFKKIMRTGRG